MRVRTDSSATAACSRGPNALEPTAAGNGALVRSPQAAQHSACARCSVTSIAIAGSSKTWWRRG
jgi:hypothetical protein